MVSKSLFRDAVLLAFHKKTIYGKAWYLFQALIFTPFLIKESKKVKDKEDAAASLSAGGEDIYPMF